jgi:PRTRC genetic system protein B
LHQLAQETAQGTNLGVLYHCARKLIGLTGTLMGGYADDLFNLFYRMEPRLMVAEGFVAGTSGRRVATRYGVMESIEKIPDQDNACTRTAKSDVRLLRKPGASPLVFGKFLMASMAFVTLDDIADYLPSYEESVIEVEMDETLGRAYEHVEKDIREAVAANRGNRSLMSLMMHRLLLYTENRNATFITRHAVTIQRDGPPTLGPAQPLTLGFVESLVRSLGGETNAEVLPENVLARTERMLCWWSAAQPRQMFYENSEGKAAALNGRVFPQPPLVWRVADGELKVRALFENKRPSSSTQLAVAPFWNLSESGQVCTGSMRRRAGASVSSMPEWEKGFYESDGLCRS